MTKNMSSTSPNNLKRHGEIVRFLATAKPAAVKAVMKTASPALVKTLCECCHNVLKGNVPLTSDQKRKLQRYKSSVRALTRKKLSIKNRKKILQQGGFIGVLLRPLLGVVKDVLGF